MCEVFEDICCGRTFRSI